ncbi:MAG: hypothetical protein R3B06_18140 [Kofleriaceae bacterium]
MRRTGLLVAALLASAACDGTESADGARGACASGGALAGCPDTATDPEAACWRLVECGSYPVDGAEAGNLDWGRCVDELEGMPADRAGLVMACIASATCDELLAPGSPQPYGRPACFAYGDQ